NGRVLERRRIERARRVAFVVLGVQQVSLERRRALGSRIRERADRGSHLAIREQLLLHPERSCLEEAGEAARRDTEIRLEDALELEDRLVVEADGGEIAYADPCFAETIRGRLRGERGIALLAGESFLGSCGHDLAVTQH